MMTLRRRLLLGLVLVVTTLLGAGIVARGTYQSFLLRQLDAHLQARTAGLNRLFGVGRGAGSGRLATQAYADLYAGTLDSGKLTTITTPDGGEGQVPVLPAAPPTDTQFTVRATDGTSMRILIVKPATNGPMATMMPESALAVLGLSLSPMDAALDRLTWTLLAALAAVTAALALVGWWVLRLGLHPIDAMSDTADAIVSGDPTVRAPTFPAGTEAARLGTALNLLIDTNQVTEGRLRRFVQDASHELRTPLTTLRGYSALYEAGGFPDKTSLDDAMRRISSESTRMSSMVDELLELAELDENRPRELSEVDVAAIVHDATADLRVIAPQRRITARVSTTPITMRADRSRIEQSVQVLTSNALRHTPATASIVLRAHLTDEGRARVEVEDDGPGIAADHLPHVFERFYRADSGRSTRGTGLGLSIVASIVNAHGGTFGVVSPLTTGHGSLFWFELPVTPASATQ